jgi:hypothetical protein
MKINNEEESLLQFLLDHVNIYVDPLNNWYVEPKKEKTISEIPKDKIHVLVDLIEILRAHDEIDYSDYGNKEEIDNHKFMMAYESHKQKQSLDNLSRQDLYILYEALARFNHEKGREMTEEMSNRFKKIFGIVIAQIKKTTIHS